jgi:hypothetical protein
MKSEKAGSNAVKKYLWGLLVLGVIAAVIVIFPFGEDETPIVSQDPAVETNIFTINQDPTTDLVSALEESKPVFIEFYSAR